MQIPVLAFTKAVASGPEAALALVLGCPSAQFVPLPALAQTADEEKGDELAGPGQAVPSALKHYDPDSHGVITGGDQCVLVGVFACIRPEQQ
jgi:hypothetical protein